MQKHLARIAALVAVGIVLASCGSDEPADAGVADATTTASVVNTASAFLDAADADGTWIIAITEDLVVDEEIVLTGDYTNRDEPARKVALYAQDAERNVTARYTLTAPRLTVKSPNARIQGGTFVGDVIVDAVGFQVVDATIDGDVVFATQAQRDSLVLDDGTITGAVSVE